ncbi:hypothetical protein [uncultured Dokdonia sp.]|uniref:hypothetical protein n=1 Tax=uncultured Dokdonia sp. TaxID=575653 RepID=UPI002612644D|nr:hypothetical protein [uncultured Dokdonia sp.]
MNTIETNFDFGKVKIQEHIVIAEMKEGITFDTNYNTVFLTFCKNHFKEKTYGYISNRIHSYSVNPTVYLDTAKNSNIRAIAIVSSDPMNQGNAHVERQFFEHPFEVFSTLDQAIKWMNEILSN